MSPPINDREEKPKIYFLDTTTITLALVLLILYFRRTLHAMYWRGRNISWPGLYVYIDGKSLPRVRTESCSYCAEANAARQDPRHSTLNESVFSVGPQPFPFIGASPGEAGSRKRGAADPQWGHPRSAPQRHIPGWVSG